jgi:hypothetical protein
MTGKGWVTTARGEALNMDELIMQAERPIGFKDAKSEVKPKVLPKRVPINVRGYAPEQGEARVPEMPQEVSNALDARQSKTPRRVTIMPGKAESMADLTRIRIDKPKFTKEVPKGGAEAASEAVLDNILGDLSQDTPKFQKAAEDEEKAPKKAKKKASKK